MSERSQSRRLGGDEGAVLVEFALVAPLLALLTLGIFEFGTAWRESNRIAGAIRSAVRQDSNLGENRSADYFALQALTAEMAGSKNITVNRVVIYKSTTANGAPPAACLTTATSPTGAGVTNQCNIYTWAQASGAQSNFTASCTNGTGASWDRFWCPTDRESGQAAVGGPDYVGVYISVSYKTVTKVLPSTSLTITDKAIGRLEPAVT